MDKLPKTEFHDLVDKIAKCHKEGLLTEDERNFIITQLLACQVEKTISDSVNAN